MKSARKSAFVIATIPLLFLLLAVLISRKESDSSVLPGNHSGNQEQEVTTLANSDSPSSPSESSATTLVSPPEAANTRIHRGENNTLILAPHKKVERNMIAGSTFDEAAMQVREGALSGTLTLSEHSLSAVEAAYDPEVIDRFLNSGAESILVPLDGEKVANVKVSEVITRGPVTHTLVGTVDGSPLTAVTLVFHDGVVSGSVAFYQTDEHFQFGSAGNGDVAIRKLDPTSFTEQCGDPNDTSVASNPASRLLRGSPAPSAQNFAAEAAADPTTAPESSEVAEYEVVQSDAAVTMDSVIGYGAGARAAEGSTAAIEALIIASVDRTNASFSNSGVTDTEMVLLGMIEDPDYVFPGNTAGTMSSGDELGSLSNGSDGELDAVTDLRSLLGADQAGFVVRSTDGSAGVAWRPGDEMIVARTYMTSTRLTFAHEFGHNIGLRHSWGDSSGDGLTTVNNYGWRLAPVSSVKVRTIMAYDWGWGNGTRIQHFSAPNVLFAGARTGAVDGYNATGDITTDPRYVSGGLTGAYGAGFNGTNPNLGARHADYIQSNAPTMAARRTRTAANPEQEISVEQPAGNDLTDGAATVDFGTSAGGFPTTRTFTVFNRGAFPLAGLNVTFTGSSASNFSVTTPPPTSISSLSSTTFTIQFSANTSASHSATLHLASNDADENPFDITVTGTGIAALSSLSEDFDPDIDNSLWLELTAGLEANTAGQAAGTGSSGNSLWFNGSGSRYAITKPVDTSSGGHLSFVIARGSGGTNWDSAESGDEIVVEYSTDGSSYTQLGGPYTNVEWQQYVIPLPIGAQASATLFRFRQLNNGGDGFDNHAIDSVVIGSAPPPEPEITIEQPVGSGLSDGLSTVDFGTADLGSSNSLVFSIRNDGTGNLTGLTPSFTGSHASDFSVTSSATAPLIPGATTNFTVRFSPGATGYRNATLQIASNDGNEDPFEIDLLGSSGVAEIEVEAPGNVSLTDGSSNVNFGNVSAGSNEQITFTVRNQGQLNLENLSASVVGADANRFSIGSFGQTTLTANASTTFTVTFSPANLGTHSAELRIISSDLDESPFNISLSGLGLASDITIEQPVGNDLDSGTSTIAFGNSNLGFPVVRTLTIRNEGNVPLTGLTTSVSGTHSANFVANAPSPTTLNVGASTTVDVTFSPSAVGSRLAVLQVGSNDPDEDPFNISLLGTGVNPEISIEHLGNDLTDGTATIDYGDVAATQQTVKTFTIHNTGDGPLSNLGLIVDGPNASEFVAAGLSATSIDTNMTATFTVTHAAQSFGPRSADLHVTSDDADENPFDIHLTSNGLDPEIVVEPSANNPFTSGVSEYDFGDKNLTTVITQTFTIRNIGTLDLTGLTVGLSGPESNDYSLGALGQNSLTTDESTTFTLTFAPTETGPLNAILTIGSNDRDESPFTVSLTGTGTMPELTLEQPATNILANGTPIDFGQVLMPQSVTRTFTVRNSGDGLLNDLAVFIAGTNSSQFVASTPSRTSIPAGETATFDLTFSPDIPGEKNASMVVTFDDPTETPFSASLTGEGIAPEIVVEQPLENSLTDEASTVAFGSTPPGVALNRTFTIRNTGNADLTGLSTSFAGSHTSDFIASALGSTTLIPGDSTTINVSFNPGDFGDRSATLRVASNDSDENPFDIVLTGSGGFPDIEIEQGTILVDGASEIAFDTMFTGGSGTDSIPITIRNVGQAPLTSLSASIYGDLEGNFSIAALGTTTLSAGQDITVNVTFSPTTLGSKSAALHISSNDPEESPFDIALSGDLLQRTTLVTWAAEFGLDGTDPNADFDGDLLTLLEEYAFNLDPRVQDALPLVPGVGTGGIPSIRLVNGRLQIEYIHRRSDPDLTYSIEFGNALTGAALEAATEEPSTTAINPSLRRTVVNDSETSTTQSARFGRVLAEYPED